MAPKHTRGEPAEEQPQAQAKSQDKDAVVTDTVVAAAFVSASELGAGASPDLHAAATGSSHSPTSMDRLGMYGSGPRTGSIYNDLIILKRDREEGMNFKLGVDTRIDLQHSVASISVTGMERCLQSLTEVMSEKDIEQMYQIVEQARAASAASLANLPATTLSVQGTHGAQGEASEMDHADMKLKRVEADCMKEIDAFTTTAQNHIKALFAQIRVEAQHLKEGISLKLQALQAADLQ